MSAAAPTGGADGWDPAQYDKFEAERRQPFDDLVALCRSVAGGSVVDLGCGSGALTAALHEAMGAASTLGIDSSPAMLAKAPAGVTGLRFEVGDLAAWQGPPVDLVFSNAALHWVGDHPGLLARLRGQVLAGGQLAFQVPANFSHPSHRAAREVAAEPRFAEALAGHPPVDRATAVLAPTEYAQLLYDLGATEQVVRLQVYAHVLGATGDVIEWVAGTLLTPYRERFDDATYDAFVARYRERLFEAVGDRRPYFYGFSRILAWAQFH